MIPSQLLSTCHCHKDGELHCIIAMTSILLIYKSLSYVHVHVVSLGGEKASKR